jgi:hypothetical protein
MKLRLLIVAIAGAGLALIPAPADAKGVREMSISGPGLATPIHLDDTTADAALYPNALAGESGLWFLNQTPDRITASRPGGDLGPRYVATYHWLVAQDKTAPIRQELYPFADGGAVTYTPPSQKVGEGTPPGGWYRAGPKLTLLLVAVGVPVPASYAAPVPIADVPRLTG